MRLYEKLFGLRLMKPDDGGEGGGGGAADRGDNYTPPAGATPPAAAAAPAASVEDDLKIATGEDVKDDTAPVVEEEQPRTADGKFAKKEKPETDGAMIPKSRFDEQVRKEREGREAAERRAAELERQQEGVKRNADVEGMIAKVAELRAQERKAIIDGDEEKAASLSSEADRLNRQIVVEQSSTMSEEAKNAAIENMRFDLVVERLYEKYPALDENNEAFDQDLVDDVLDKQRGLIERERLTPSKAIEKAAKIVMDRRTQPAAEETPAAKPNQTLADGQKAVDRKTAAVAKNIDAANRQPAGTKQVGADSDKHGQTKSLPEAGDMTQEEFAALPEATKAKMRGDFV